MRSPLSFKLQASQRLTMISDDLGFALPPGTAGGPSSYTPSEEEVISAINLIWCLYWNSYSTMSLSGLLLRIQNHNNSWRISEKRLREIRGKGLADGRLKQPLLEQGLKMRPDEHDVQLREEQYVFKILWRRARRAGVCELIRKFEVTSGEIVWGQLPAFVSGMKSHARDNRNTSRCSMDGDALVSPFRFRVAAKPGVWKVAKVNAVPTSAPEITGYIVYHSSVSPIRVLSSARRTNCHSREPLVTYVNRYAWGADGADTGDYARTVADADPEEWDARWARKWRMYLDGVHMDKFHQDSAAWDRLARFGGGAMFFADAARAPEVLKMVARPSDLDVRMCKKKSSSLYSEDSNATMPSRPFGCHLVLPEGEGHEVGRLVYSAEKSARFPDDDELIAFWYDNRHWPYADDELLHDPILERV